MNGFAEYQLELSRCTVCYFYHIELSMAACHYRKQ